MIFSTGRRETPGAIIKDAVQKTLPVERRILVVDSQPLMRRGLRALIENETDLTVCAQSASYSEGLEAISTSEIELVITELLFADGDPFSFLQSIRCRDDAVPILVLTTHDAPRYAQRALTAGANGYVSKQASGTTLIRAIRELLDGGQFVSPTIGGTI